MYDADPRDAYDAADDRPTRAELDREEWEARQIMDERESRCATPGEAHAEWHLNAGVPMGTPGCPQDACHPIEDFEPEPEPGEGVRCAHCKGRHWDVNGVRRCAAATLPTPAPAAAPAVSYAGALGYAGACEGGRCDVYNRCNKHRAQDAAAGVPNAMFKSYND
jgi:hypothetical protein